MSRALRELWIQTQMFASCKPYNKYCGNRCPVGASWSSLLLTVVLHQIGVNMCESHLDSWNRPLAFKKGSLWGKAVLVFYTSLNTQGVPAHALQAFRGNRPKSWWAQSTVWLCPWWGNWSPCYTVVCWRSSSLVLWGWHFSCLFVLSLALHSYVLAAGQSLLSQQLYWPIQRVTKLN